MSDESLDERVARLHEALRATEELPVGREAGRWLGEAQAVVGDVATGDAAESVVRERVERVSELLAHVDETGSDEADERVATAKRLADEILDEA